jgi:phosphomethylpyrimidine synthase
MKISQDVREYANKKGLDDLAAAVEVGMSEKSQEFTAGGSEIYKEA